MDDTNPDISKSAVKPKIDKELDPIARRDSSNSQRSFRVRTYKRSISRGSNYSKLSNLTENRAGETPAAKKTIEHPTDVEDANANFDDASDFDELGYEFFNTTGDPDVAVGSSLDDADFQEYVYTAGVTDDGIGTPLPEFIQFAIKIVGQGTNAAEVPRIRDFRAIALAT